MGDQITRESKPLLSPICTSTVHIIYIIFSIIGLVVDYDKFKKCEDFSVWIYVFVNIFLSLSKRDAYKHYSDIKIENVCIVFWFCLMNLVLGLWGVDVIFHASSCINKVSYLYVVAFITMTINMISGSKVIYNGSLILSSCTCFVRDKLQITDGTEV